MADSRNRTSSGPHTYRGESSKLILDTSVAGEVKNFIVSREGSLYPVMGPTKVLSYRGLSNSAYEDTGLGEVLFDSFLKSKKYGIHHARLQDGKEILLFHTDAGIQEYLPQNRRSDKSAFKNIIGDNNSIFSDSDTLKESDPFLIDTDLLLGDLPQFPTQFVTTDKGVIIIPQNFQRSYIYNGYLALPLGYDTIPCPPQGLGPADGGGKIGGEMGPNTAGYFWRTARQGEGTHPKSLGQGRLGTLNTTVGGEPDGENRAKLMPGSWRCAVQWMDYFGNFSPMSDRSAEITLSGEACYSGDDYLGDIDGADLKTAVIWDAVDPGPPGTMGRRLYRTKDLVNSGDGKLYFLSGNVGYSSLSSNVSMPDNMSTHFADNIPDGWLTTPAFTDFIPVPSFKLGCFALGRFWIGNTSAESGVIIPSLPGRYGTFAGSAKIYPDTGHSTITGLCATEGGVLAFTESSVSLITPNDSGEGFKALSLSGTIGCVAPSSISALPDGSLCWLGKEGFYRLTGETVEIISGPIQNIVDRITKSRALQAVAVFDPTSQEYRCWVPMDGNTENSLCLIYDTHGWRRRTNEHVSCACVTKDSRKYVYCGGSVYSGEGFTDTVTSKNDDEEVYRGFFILDHENAADWSEDSLIREYVVETGWLEWTRSIERVSAKTLYFSLIETSSEEITVEVYRDWKKVKPVYSDTFILHSAEDEPNLWGKTKLPAVTETTIDTVFDSFEKRKPFWKAVDIAVPSCEVYRVRIRSRAPFEFLGMINEESIKPNAKTRVP
jgi:hypothetical protein